MDNSFEVRFINGDLIQIKAEYYNRTETGTYIFYDREDFVLYEMPEANILYIKL